jgi:toxin ParE1/3/4
MTSPTARRIYKHEQAKEDLIEIYAFLLERNERAARMFLSEAIKAFDLILNIPGVGKRWESPIAELVELRVTTVSRRFRDYLIFYRPVLDGVQIVTVLHGARDLPPLIESLRFDEKD